VYSVLIVLVHSCQHEVVGKWMVGHFNKDMLIIVRPLGTGFTILIRTCGSNIVPIWSVVLARVVTCNYMQHTLFFPFGSFVFHSHKSHPLKIDHAHKVVGGSMLCI